MELARYNVLRSWRGCTLNAVHHQLPFRHADPAPASDAAADRADVPLLTGLHEELPWIQRVSGFQYERRIRQGISCLLAEVRGMGTAASESSRSASWR